MAERRMMAKSIIDSDAFLDMPISAQALYFHLLVRADDDGFNNSCAKIMRMVCATKNDMDILILKRFVITFDTGIVVIKHWRIHNYIQKDRYKETLHTNEKEQLEIKTNGAYTIRSEVVYPLQIDDCCDSDTLCIQDAYNMDAQVSVVKSSLDKIRLDKSSLEKSIGRFTPPSLKDIEAYCKETKSKIDPQTFFDYYEANGWMTGRVKMKNWKAALRNWNKREFNQIKPHGKSDSKPKNQNFKQDTIATMGEDEMKEILKRKADRKARESD